MPDNESDFEEHRHDLVLETFQPSWEKHSVAEVTNPTRARASGPVNERAAPAGSCRRRLDQMPSRSR
jgi:hypothetical protein